MHGPRCSLQELPGHVHFCMGAYGEDCSRLRNFEGFNLVTNLKETKQAKCNNLCRPSYSRSYLSFRGSEGKRQIIRKIIFNTDRTRYKGSVEGGIRQHDRRRF